MDCSIYCVALWHSQAKLYADTDSSITGITLLVRLGFPFRKIIKNH